MSKELDTLNDSITQNIKRIGSFTSSEIVALTSMGTRGMTEVELAKHKKNNPGSRKKNIECWPGKAALTYIGEKRMEKNLGRSLDNDIDSRPTIWGKFVEPIVFSKLLSDEYEYCSNETCTHPEFNFWAGTPDGFKSKKVVAEMKAPFTLKSFCQLVQPLYDGLEGIDAMNAIRNGYVNKNGIEYPPHKDGEKFYWQKVSNCCIKGYNHAELIVYCPYESELEIIQHLAFSGDTPAAYFIYSSEKSALPYLKDNGYYKNINFINFEVPEEDKIFLTDCVKKAGELLNK